MKTLLLIVIFFLSGCQTMRLLDEYEKTAWFGEKVRTDDGCFQLWQHKEENKLWVQECFGRGVGKAVASGTVQGATFGAVDGRGVWSAEREYEKAASVWLLENKKGCIPSDSDLVEGDGSSGWEVSYECDLPIK